MTIDDSFRCTTGGSLVTVHLWEMPQALFDDPYKSPLLGEGLSCFLSDKNEEVGTEVLGRLCEQYPTDCSYACTLSSEDGFHISQERYHGRDGFASQGRR